MGLGTADFVVIVVMVGAGCLVCSVGLWIMLRQAASASQRGPAKGRPSAGRRVSGLVGARFTEGVTLGGTYEAVWAVSGREAQHIPG